MDSSDALVTFADHILNSINSLNKLEYNKNGRKYKFINNGFQRVKQEDKHLIINDADMDMKCSIISSYNILHTINNGELLEQYPDFCLSIIGVARELELNGWGESSNVIQYDEANQYPVQLIHDALEYSSQIKPTHLEMGLNLLMASKLNFFHTDHHLGTKIYGVYLIKYMKDYFGEDSINNAEMLIALKSFVHWGSIKCILYKLGLPNIYLTDDEFLCYKNFPNPPQELKEEIWNKYPSGTSKFYLIKNSLSLIMQTSDFATLIPYPEDDKYSLDWLFKLCKDIETDPIKYHLRSSSKTLCEEPANLNELNQTTSEGTAHLLNLVSMIINIFGINLETLNKNSKIPKLENVDEPELKAKYQDLQTKIQNYVDKDWNVDDIILRLGTGSVSLTTKVEEMFDTYQVKMD